MLLLDEQDKLLMIPGPTPVQREILDALAEPTISHTSGPMAAIVSRCLAGLREVMGTERGSVFVFGGAGTLAQEAAVINLVEPGEHLLVLSNGYFGDRFIGIAQAHGIKADRVAAEWGESVTSEQLDRALSVTPARAVTITQVETSTGVLAPVAELASVAREHGSLVIVDAVCSLGGVPVSMDAWNIDILLSGAQKALGVPPGLAILGASPRALERRRSLDRIPTYYADLLNWEPSMNNPELYFSTHAVNLFYALRSGMEIIAREGLDARFARHDRLARSFRAGMVALGFRSLTAARYHAPTMSVMAYPERIDDAAFRAALSARGVIAAGCLGDFKGRGARFGHMGNITEAEIVQAVGAVGAVLAEMGAGVDAGAGAGAAVTATSPAPAH